MLPLHARRGKQQLCRAVLAGDAGLRESHYMDFLEPVSSERGRQSGREEIFEAKQLKSLSWTYVFFPSADLSQIAIIKWGLFRVGLSAFTQNPTLRQKVSAVGVSMSSQTRLHPLKFAASDCCSVATGSVAENQKDLGRNPAGTRPSLLASFAEMSTTLLGHNLCVYSCVPRPQDLG